MNFLILKKKFFFSVIKDYYSFTLTGSSDVQKIKVLGNLKVLFFHS